MTFLESLIKKWLPSSRVELRLLPSGGREVRVLYSDKDWAYYANDASAQTVALARELIPTRPRKRRLHWGRCRPRSGVLRLEMRGHFGQTPAAGLGPEWVGNTLGAP